MSGNIQFLNQLALTPRPDGGIWTVDHSFEAAAHHSLLRQLPHGRITVPAGFATDLASIPALGPVGGGVMLAAFILAQWFPWAGWALMFIGFLVTVASAYLLHYGKYTRAAVLHDWLYRSHLVHRYIADQVLLEAMKECQTARWERVAIYWNVRLFGWVAWRNEKRWVTRRPHTARFD